jgi:DNA-binding MarR family transcriptional regulator
MTQSNFVDESVAGWSRLIPEHDMISLEVVQRLIWSGRLAHKLMERAAIASGLQRRGDYEVLALLRRFEPTLLTPLQAAQQLLTSPSGMTGKLDRLEEQGLIQRTPDLQDRRAVRLTITDTGRALIDEAFTTSLEVYEFMLDDLSRAEVESLEVLLEKLLKRLDQLTRSVKLSKGG